MTVLSSRGHRLPREFEKYVFELYIFEARGALF
jgi:hypothetical protein